MQKQKVTQKAKTAQSKAWQVAKAQVAMAMLRDSQEYRKLAFVASGIAAGEALIAFAAEGTIKLNGQMLDEAANGMPMIRIHGNKEVSSLDTAEWDDTHEAAEYRLIAVRYDHPSDADRSVLEIGILHVPTNRVQMIMSTTSAKLASKHAKRPEASPWWEIAATVPEGLFARIDVLRALAAHATYYKVEGAMAAMLEAEAKADPTCRCDTCTGRRAMLRYAQEQCGLGVPKEDVN